MSNEIKVGDKVRVSKDAPEEFERFKGDDMNYEVVRINPSKVIIQHKLAAGVYGFTLSIPAKYLVKVDAEAKEAKFKVGDRVRSKGYGLEAVVLGVYGDYIAVEREDGIKQEWKRCITELIEPTEQTEAEKPNHTIKIPVEVDLSDSYWDAYAADLAKEVALKVANKYNDPEQAADYAVSVAKAVVDGLKRK